MRKLTKAAKPEILAANDVNWTAELLAEEKGTAAYKTVEKRYRHAQIKEALKSETISKCAYCESQIEGVAFLHIEHIVPRVADASLTFEWANLTLSCPECNLNKDVMVPTPQNYVHPYNDVPESRLGFIGNMIQAAPGDVTARNMVNWIDLNRTGLFVARSEVVNRVRDIYERAITLPVGSRREFIDLSLRPLVSAKAKYSRVAVCNAELFEVEYAEMLAVDN